MYKRQVHGLDHARSKWGGIASKCILMGEKNAVRYADEIVVLSKGIQDYFKQTYGRKTRFIPNGVNRPEIRQAKLITEKFGLEKDSYILFLGRLVPEKGLRYLIKAFRQVDTGKMCIRDRGKPVNRSNVWKEMKALCASARVLAVKVFPHNLRHLFARTYYRMEKDISKLADLLGHSSINTTRIYICLLYTSFCIRFVGICIRTGSCC